MLECPYLPQKFIGITAYICRQQFHRLDYKIRVCHTYLFLLIY